MIIVDYSARYKAIISAETAFYGSTFGGIGQSHRAMAPPASVASAVGNEEVAFHGVGALSPEFHLVTPAALF